MNRFVLASSNPGKLREFSEMLAPLGLEVVPQSLLGIEDAEEPHGTFVENALAKARHAARLGGLPALADDSGLCVDALGGDPGLFSARWAGPTKDFAMAMRSVEDRLNEEPDMSRTAHFVCALAVGWPDGHVEWFEGRVDGTIVWPPRGDKGHGYDPIFQPLGKTETFAEMDQDEKNRISHRADAFGQLVKAVF